MNKLTKVFLVLFVVNIILWSTVYVFKQNKVKQTKPVVTTEQTSKDEKSTTVKKPRYQYSMRTETDKNGKIGWKSYKTEIPEPLDNFGGSANNKRSFHVVVLPNDIIGISISQELNDGVTESIVLDIKNKKMTSIMFQIKNGPATMQMSISERYNLDEINSAIADFQSIIDYRSQSNDKNNKLPKELNNKLAERLKTDFVKYFKTTEDYQSLQWKKYKH